MNFRIITFVLLLFPTVALACVDTRSGNYCAHYKDISQKSGDHELNLTRTYHSQSSAMGWFGYGWGTPFETRLVVMPDGSAMVNDPSTLKSERYISQKDAGLQAGVEKIVAVAAAKEGLGAEASSALRGQLFLSEELRSAKVRQHEIFTQLAIGEKLHSDECAKALVTRIGNEYQRTTCGKGIDYFDLTGRLVRKEEEGYTIVIHFAGDRPDPDSIVDSLGQKLNLKWTATGRVVEAQSEQNLPVIKYRYDEKENLIFSSEEEGSGVTYAYDATHKMTKIGRPDNTYIELKYDEAGRLISLNDSDSAPISYTYQNDSDYPTLHHWTTETKTQGEGRQTIRVAEYFSTLDTFGTKRLSRVLKTNGSEIEEIVLDEKGRFKRISKSYGSFSEFSYHPTLGKVTVVATNEDRTDFGYDTQGKLVRAMTGKGHLVTLTYDRHNNIVRMVEGDKSKHVQHDLLFKYNAQKKPIKISMVGKGEINIFYDKQGEIAKVDSKQGAKMALEVTQAFQGLLSLVKVASANYCL